MNGVNIGGTARRGARARVREPRLHVGDEPRIAQAQVLVRDPLAAGEQAVRELRRLERGVARDVLEPLGGIARRVLDLQHLDGALRLVGGERGGEIRVGADLPRQRDPVLERELRPRADGKMRGVRGIADQHDRHAARVDLGPVDPRAADDARELDPHRRTAEVRRVGQQRLAVEPRREEPLAVGDPFLLGHSFEARLLPDVLGRLDDERRGVAVVLVGVRLEPAVLRLDERERERPEPLLRAEPDEPAAPDVDVGRERIEVARPDAAVEPVGGDDEIRCECTRRLDIVPDLGLEYELDAERLAALLQDVEEALAADAAEAMTAGRDRRAAKMDVDVVPMVERAGDLGRRRRVGRLEVAHRVVGEHHAPAERVVRAVALDDANDVAGVCLLEQQREIEAGGAAADAKDSHVSVGEAEGCRAGRIFHVSIY